MDEKTHTENMNPIRVVYHLGHYAYLWRFLVHKLTYHPHERALFLIDNVGFVPATDEFIRGRIGKFSFFEDVYIFNESKFKKLPSENEVEETVCKFFDKVLEGFECDLHSCLVYSGFDVTNSFTIYLTLRKKTFTMCNMDLRITAFDRYEIERPDPPFFWNVQRKHKALTWDNKYASDIIWFTIANSETIPDIPKPSVILESNESIEKISENDKRLLFSFFEIPPSMPERFNMIICSSKWIRTKIHSDREYVMIYAQMADYFFEASDEIIIKPHPQGDCSDSEWSFFFPHSTIIRGYVPSQLLTIIPNFAPHKIISTSHTGALEGYEYCTANLTQKGILCYKLHHKLFIALSMVKTLGDNIKLNVDLGSAMPFFDIFIKELFPELLPLLVNEGSDIKNTVKITDDIFGSSRYDISEDLPKNSIIFYLDSHGNHTPDLQNMKYSLPIYIHKELSKPIPETADETFFIYSTDKCLRDQLYDYSQKYHLKHTDMQISVSSTACKLQLEHTISLISRGFDRCSVTLVVSDKKDIEYNLEILSALGIEHSKINILNTKKYFRAKEEYFIFGFGCDSKTTMEFIKDLCISHFLDYVLIENDIISHLPSNNAYGDLELIIGKNNSSESDLKNAVKYLKKSATMGNVAAMNSLTEIPPQNLSDGELRDVYNLCSKFAKEGNTGAMGRLARMYRDGKGADKNIDLAIEWMKKAAEKNLKWAKNEYIDLLLNRSAEGDLEEAYRVCSEFAKTGDVGAMGRLARMYRDGKGADKNIDLAIEWMKKAAEKNLGWAKNELDDLLISKNRKKN